MFTYFGLSVWTLKTHSKCQKPWCCHRLDCKSDLFATFLKYRYKPIQILSISISSSDASIGNIDILALVSPITIMMSQHFTTRVMICTAQWWMDSKLHITLEHMVKIKFVTFWLSPHYFKFRDLPIILTSLLAYYCRPNFCTGYTTVVEC